jgi:PUA domain protein
MVLRNRHPIREKDGREVAEALTAMFGADFRFGGKRVETAEDEGFTVFLVEGVPMAFRTEGRVVPTVKGLLEFPATRRFVTVDEGAVPFLLRGADVMAPGVVDADPEVAEGDVVWVREEKHKRPLAVGVALMDGKTMAAAEKGKAVRTLHHLRDKLWDLTQGAPA